GWALVGARRTAVLHVPAILEVVGVDGDVLADAVDIIVFVKAKPNALFAAVGAPRSLAGLSPRLLVVCEPIATPVTELPVFVDLRAVPERPFASEEVVVVATQRAQLSR